MIRKNCRALLGLFLAVLFWSGVASAEKIKVQLAPNLAAYNVEKVAILGLANTSGDTEATQMGTHLLRAFSSANKYHFTTAEQFALDAKRTGVGTEYDRVRSTWFKKRTMEPTIVKKLLEATKFDAVVGMEVSRWEKTTIDPLDEGTSDTSVGVLVRMVAQDGTILWSATETKIAQSEPYLPSLRSTVGGEAVVTGSVPQPPDIKKVAADLAMEIVATMPSIKKAPATPKEAPPAPPKETPPASPPNTSTAPSDTSGSPD